MSRTNVPLLSFNRGIISTKGLARVDLDRTRLSAEEMRNWLPSTLGPMSIRPGTKFFGSSLNDTGAEFIEFVASTDDVALVELTGGKARIWLGDDAHALALLSRPSVDTTVSLSDTGWDDASTGGSFALSQFGDELPTMTAATTDGVTITTGGEDGGQEGWRAADDNQSSVWNNSGSDTGTWWWKVNFGAGNAKRLKFHTLRATTGAASLNRMPSAWKLQGNNVDTGDGWTTEVTVTGQTGWAVGERRQFTDTGYTDTGANSWQYWRIQVTAVNGASEVEIEEVELKEATPPGQADFNAQGLVLNATSLGALAKATKRVIVSDTGTEHALAITVDRGPVTLRVGSTSGDDDYIRETALGTGYHNLAFTPNNNFWITLQSSALVDRIVSSVEISDSGTVELTAPWANDNLDDIRYDQSADVVYVDCEGVRPQKIERRGTGRSWSIVNYEPTDGPFLAARSTSAKLAPHRYAAGNTTLTSDVPFFTSNHVGAIFRLFHQGQDGTWLLGATDAVTDPVVMTGISDTGTPSSDSERRIVIQVTGTYSGEITIERSIDGEDIGFKTAPASFAVGADTGWATDTGSISLTIDDPDDNLKVWYRARMSRWTSGVASVFIDYGGGGKTGFARVTAFNNNQSVDIETLTGFSRKDDTGGQTDNWQEGYWSNERGFPTAVALHGGRLFHAQGGSLFGSVSDRFESYDDDVEGDAGPIIRTLGAGPVDRIRYLVSLLRLLIGTSGAELTARSSSLDEPLTPENSSVAAVSTQGSANVRALKMDTRALMVQRSAKRVYMVGPAQNTLADYEAFDLTLLVPDLLAAGVRSVAVQRQPDTRLHCVLGDGTVAILVYEPVEEVICWLTWETDGIVERAVCLPGLSEDAIYYHIQRDIARGNDAFTKVLLHFDGADGSTSIADTNAGGSSHAWGVNGNARLDRSTKLFGSGASLLCDGTGDYASTPDHADFALGTGDFSVDLWCRWAGGAATLAGLCGQRAASAAATTAFSIHKLANGTIEARVSNGTTNTDVISTTNIEDGNWHHIAFERAGNVLHLFVDGVQEGGDVAFSGAVPNLSEPLHVGMGSTAGSMWTGWIDEFRISVGTARWTSAFTPPDSPYAASPARYLEKWALEEECMGDTGLSFIMDCAKSYTDTGRATTLTGFTHLAGEQVVVWADDTGAASANPWAPDAGKDLSPDVAGVQTTYLVNAVDGTITLNEAVHHAVAGLPFTARWKSSKLAYGAELGTALGQQKRAPQLAMILYRTHNNALRFCAGDTGRMDPLPRMIDGALVDSNTIFETLDKVAVPTPSTWHPDTRVVIEARAPRPATILAMVPSVVTNER